MLLNVCKTKPFNHQAKALELGHKQRVFAYFHGDGYRQNQSCHRQF